MLLPTKRTGPGGWKALGCSLLVVCFVVGGLGLYIAHRGAVAGRDADLVAEVRTASVAALVVGMLGTAAWIALRKLL